jgi:purine nucleosidase
VKELVIMGGVFLGTTGHAGMPGEFNVFTDPEAAAAVLRCGAPQRWVGLDVTLRVRLTRAHARALADGSGPFGRFAGAAALAWIDYLGDDSCAMHDPLAVAAVAHPELLTWADVHVEVETGESVTRGVMAADWQRDGGGVGTLTPNCRVATDVDVVAALGYMTGTLAGL